MAQEEPRRASSGSTQPQPREVVSTSAQSLKVLIIFGHAFTSSLLPVVDRILSVWGF
jgi:hypothetical protein